MSISAADIASGSRVFDLAIPAVDPGHETQEIPTAPVEPPLEPQPSQDRAGPGAPVSREEVVAFLACAPLGGEYAPTGCAPTAPPAYGSALDTERAVEVARAYRELLGDSPRATAGRAALANAALDPRAEIGSATSPAGRVYLTEVARVLGQVRLLGLGARYARGARRPARGGRGRDRIAPARRRAARRARSTRARWGCRSRRRRRRRAGKPAICRRSPMPRRAVRLRLLGHGYYRGPRTPRERTARFPCCARVSSCGGCSRSPCCVLGAAHARALTYEPVYRVSEIIVEYALDSPQQIPLDEVLDLEVGLQRAEDAYVAPRPVDRTVRIRLSALPRDASFGASALLHINQYIVASFNRRGFNGVIVAVPDIEEGTGRDLRPPGVTALRLRIWTGQVSRVATIADGERFGGLSADERTNHAAHAWIRERSPVRPGGPRGLLSVTALEDYAAEISRHPGRRMDVEVAPGPRAGTTAVNLRITESKPWYVYAQYANTGTSTTTLNRERFGFTHNQLLGRDDILSLDYTTGDFDEVHAVSGAYAAPFDLARARVALRARRRLQPVRRARGGLHRHQRRGPGRERGRRDLAAALSTPRAVRRRRGRRALAAHRGREPPGGRRRARRRRRLRGAARGPAPRARHRHVDAARARRRARRLDRHAAIRPRRRTLSERANRAGPSSTCSATRTPDDDFALTSFDASWSFYLEPLLDPWGWRDPNQKKGGTLAHEVAFLARGQWAMDHRLVPQFQQVAGGFTTVRGYKQSAVVGDDLAARLGRVPLPPAAPVLARPEPARAAGHGRVPAAPHPSLGRAGLGPDLPRVQRRGLRRGEPPRSRARRTRRSSPRAAASSSRCSAT